jgi:hypothetical protein
VIHIRGAAVALDDRGGDDGDDDDDERGPPSVLGTLFGASGAGAGAGAADSEGAAKKVALKSLFRAHARASVNATRAAEEARSRARTPESWFDVTPLTQWAAGGTILNSTLCSFAADLAERRRELRTGRGTRVMTARRVRICFLSLDHHSESPSSRVSGREHERAKNTTPRKPTRPNTPRTNPSEYPTKATHPNTPRNQLARVAG